MKTTDENLPAKDPAAVKLFMSDKPAKLFNMNQPVTASRMTADSKNPYDQVTKGWQNMGLELGAMDENTLRQSKRETAGKVMIAGAIVLFAGIAVSASSKKKDLILS